ncbi:immunity 22 family protein [Myroides sp.]|uniref:immunity 22 family protein n=1 Tax=Myroides sp. TaxID=1874736 RepID=UPI003F3D04A4
MEKIHVWIGTFSGTEEEFNAYFEIDKKRVELGIGGSQFDRDIGINWYDDDHIGAYWTSDHNLLQHVVDDVIESKETLEEIYKDCLSKGLVSANAMIYYFDDDIDVVSDNSLSLGLLYIGKYEL